MNPRRPSKERVDPEERLLELLADRAVFGLGAEEEAELATLVAAHPDEDHESLDRVAAALAVGRLAGHPVAAAPRRSPAGGRRARVGPVAAVAVSLLAIIAWPLASRRSEVAPPASDSGSAPQMADGFARARAELLDQAEDAVRLECRAIGPADEAGVRTGRPAGDIVWSPSRQRGFLRISGLPPNDPRESQYQIWIVVGRRTVPVSGGVFDVNAPRGRTEIVVPILPQEFVQSPAFFAVTAERPGGADHYSSERSQAVARAE